MIMIIRVIVIITISLIFIIKNNNDEKFKVIPISFFLLLPATSFPFSLSCVKSPIILFSFLSTTVAKKKKID